MAARSLGIVVLLFGAILLAFGLNSSGAPVDRLAGTMMSTLADGTMFYLIVGSVGVVAGLVLVLRD